MTGKFNFSLICNVVILMRGLQGFDIEQILIDFVGFMNSMQEFNGFSIPKFYSLAV